MENSTSTQQQNSPQNQESDSQTSLSKLHQDDLKTLQKTQPSQHDIELEVFKLCDSCDVILDTIEFSMSQHRDGCSPAPLLRSVARNLERLTLQALCRVPASAEPGRYASRFDQRKGDVEMLITMVESNDHAGFDSLAQEILTGARFAISMIRATLSEALLTNK